MKTRKFRKSMLSTLVILMAAVLSLTGATYAWFTSGTQAFLNDITAGVEEGSGLLISTDGKNWASNIAITKPEGFTYLALSSAGETANGQLKLFSAKLDTTGAVHKIDEIAAATGGYLTFDIYFNNANGAEKQIKFTGSSIIGNNREDGKVASARAFRIAFIDQGDLDATTVGTEFASDLIALKAGVVSTIYEPYAKDHITNGILDYKGFDPRSTNGMEFEYFGIKAAPDASVGAIDRYIGGYEQVPCVEGDAGYNADPELNGTKWVYNGAGENDYLKKVTTKTDEDLEEDATLFTIGEKSYSKITVVIWLEGQDADCLNEISGGEFKFNVGFEVIS